MSETPAVRQADLFENPPEAPNDAGVPDHDPLPEDLPFRLTPRTATAADAEARNGEHGHTRARRYRPPEEAIEMAATAKTPAASSRLLSWVLHPDERVPLAMIENQAADNDRRPYTKSADSHWIGTALVYRGLRAAREEGHLWNPLLDRAAIGQRLWRREPFTPGPTDGDRDEEIRALGDRFADVDFEGPASDYIDRHVAPWIACQEDPDALRALLRFRSRKLFEAVAAHGRVLDGALIDRLAATPSALRVLGQNDHLDAGARRAAIERMLAILAEGRPPRGAANDPPLGPTPYGTPRSWAARGLQKALMRLSREQPVPEGVAEDLLALAVPPGYTEERGLADVEDDYSDPRVQRFLEAARTLVHTRPRPGEPWDGEQRGWHDDPELLRRLYPYVAHRSRLVVHLVKHPAADLGVWRDVITDTSLFKPREWLANQEEARTDPVIREVLESSTSPDVAVRLMAEADAEAFRGYMRLVVRKDPERALSLLETYADDPRMRALERADLTPMLRSDNQKVRSEAVLAIGRLGERDDDAEPAREPPASRTP